MLQLHLIEKKRELLRREDFDGAIDGIAGVVLTHLGGMAARCSNDLAVRRKIDAVVYEVRKEMAKVALEMADRAESHPWNSGPPIEATRFFRTCKSPPAAVVMPPAVMVAAA